ncbi:MAG: prolipoprotein diacylglyceryl transferase [Caldilineaceae bacterium]
MYPVLPFGPITIPTGPIVILIAITVSLEIASRVGKRMGLLIDDVWNSGLLATLVTLIVARLWNVIQFWSIYMTEPLLIISLRPSGFIWLPGMIAGAVAAYIYFWHYALKPGAVAAALLAGAVAGGALLAVGGYLTGNLVGIPSDLPWALPYFGVPRHPVAFYYALGLLMVVGWAWFYAKRMPAGRLLLCICFGAAVVVLVAGAYTEESATVAGLRLNQLVGLGVAAVCALGLAATASAQEQSAGAEPIDKN